MSDNEAEVTVEYSVTCTTIDEEGNSKSITVPAESYKDAECIADMLRNAK
jgi:hypothetical protein